MARSKKGIQRNKKKIFTHLRIFENSCLAKESNIFCLHGRVSLVRLRHGVSPSVQLHFIKVGCESSPRLCVLFRVLMLVLLFLFGTLTNQLAQFLIITNKQQFRSNLSTVLCMSLIYEFTVARRASRAPLWRS